MNVLLLHDCQQALDSGRTFVMTHACDERSVNYSLHNLCHKSKSHHSKKNKSSSIKALEKHVVNIFLKQSVVGLARPNQMMNQQEIEKGSIEMNT